MRVSHKALLRKLKHLHLSENLIPSLEQWQAMLSYVDQSFQEADQGQYLNELSLQVTSREMSEKNRELFAWINTLKDVQNKLRHVDKMATIGQLSAGVAHEINNPLSFSLSNIGTLQKRISLLKKLIEYYKEINFDTKLDTLHLILNKITKFEEDKSIASMIEDLDSLMVETQEGLLRIKSIVESLAKFSNHKFVEMQEIDINSCLKSALNMCQSKLKYKTEIIINLGVLPPIHGDASELEIVFINLLMNAVDAIDVSGTITVSSSYVADNIIISIKDTGRGVSPEGMSKLFTPFYTTKPVGSGTGLALASAYAVVELHNGKITVESSENNGSTFTITLPVNREFIQKANND